MQQSCTYGSVRGASGNRRSYRDKTLSESFDEAQDERRDFDIIEDFPFMLRPSKHSEPFFSNLLARIVGH
jgi:hypothetical protein